MKIRHALEMIGEYGALKSVGRVLGGVFYRLAIPVYSLFICLTTAVDPKKVLFESTPAFSDNSWEMFMYLRDTSEEQYRFVWLYAPEDRLRTLENTKVVSKYSFYSAKHTTIRAIREIATSKYIFFTHSSPVEEFRPRKGQIVVNLWHGCGYKDVQKNNKAPLKFDIALVPGKAFVHTKAHFWNCSEDKILPIGYPRYDELLKSNEMAEQWAKALKANRKLVLWMPTFRSTNRHMYPEERIHQKYDLPLLSSHDQMLELDEFCREHGILLCIKRHVFQVTYAAERIPFTNIRFLGNTSFEKKGIELYAFLRYADALVTDYSSVAIDYMLLDKPIAFSLDDYEEYKKTRGFVFEDPLSYMPGHHLYRYEDMLSFLEDVSEDRDPYRYQRECLFPEIQNPCDHYCERIWLAVKGMTIDR